MLWSDGMAGVKRVLLAFFERELPSPHMYYGEVLMRIRASRY